MRRRRTTSRNCMPTLCRRRRSRRSGEALVGSPEGATEEAAVAGRVAGKVAFITGAGRGMGRSHAVRLAREGADVIALDISAPLPGIRYDQPTPEDLKETVRLVEAEGRRVVPVTMDVRDLEGMRSAVRSEERRVGK